VYVRTLLGFGDGAFKAGTLYTPDSEYYDFSAGDMNGRGFDRAFTEMTKPATPVVISDSCSVAS
jgi:hypothetical protein